MADHKGMIPDKDTREAGYETYEIFVEEHGFIRGTVRYYKALYRGEL